MAIELAIVLGFTGLIRSVPFLSALIIGAHPEACAEYILQPVSFTSPIFTSSLKALANFGRIVPPADATTMCLKSFQPSCSDTANPWVLAPSALYGRRLTFSKAQPYS